MSRPNSRYFSPVIKKLSQAKRDERIVIDESFKLILRENLLAQKDRTAVGSIFRAQPVKIDADGFFARVIQHEWDHLQGNVYLDRMANLRSLSHLSEFVRFQAKAEDGDE